MNYFKSNSVSYKQEYCYKLCADLENINTNDKKEQMKKCEQYCPLECDSVSYSFTIPESRSVESKSSLSMNYNKLEFTQFSETAKTQVFDLISNIGGILGLFIGCSFVSFFEGHISIRIN